MGTADICRRLAWDSEFFGLAIAQAGVERLDPGTLAAVESWCRANAVRCLYFLADPDDDATVKLAEAGGFRLTDIRLTLERSLGHLGSGEEPAGPIRPARPEDIPALRELAARSHRQSRFYHDGNFPRELCDELYRTWIEKSCRGWADAVLVAEEGGSPAGYITCHLHGEDRGQIGLFAVAEGSRGRGLGRKLVDGALRWLAGRGLKKAEVVTQGRNAAAQRLYQKCGFVTSSARLWYHRWFDPGTGEVGP